MELIDSTVPTSNLKMRSLAQVPEVNHAAICAPIQLAPSFKLSQLPPIPLAHHLPAPTHSPSAHIKPSHALNQPPPLKQPALHNFPKQILHIPWLRLRVRRRSTIPRNPPDLDIPICTIASISIPSTSSRASISTPTSPPPHDASLHAKTPSGQINHIRRGDGDRNDPRLMVRVVRAPQEIHAR
jgi:hypothetical protein